MGSWARDQYPQVSFVAKFVVGQETLSHVYLIDEIRVAFLQVVHLACDHWHALNANGRVETDCSLAFVAKVRRLGGRLGSGLIIVYLLFGKVGYGDRDRAFDEMAGGGQSLLGCRFEYQASQHFYYLGIKTQTQSDVTKDLRDPTTINSIFCKISCRYFSRQSSKILLKKSVLVFRFLVCFF